jgi:hypothetical protein
VAPRDRLEFSLVWNLTNPACTTRTIGCAPIIHFEKNPARTISLPINLGSYSEAKNVKASNFLSL